MSLTRPDDSAATIPSGTVTFVFTDVEGSTVRWDRDRAAMQDAMRRHDAAMRAAIAAHDGYVFKTIGDAFCVAFRRAEEAVAAVFDVQRALAAEDFSGVDGLRVRAAIHTGTADERDRDYFGPAVNRVARLLAIAYGGQVLLSGVTSDLVTGSLPAQASLRSLGEHRLKDLARPEYVYQLVGPGLAAEFPPLQSLRALPNNLPPQMKSFVGRENEVVEISALVAKHRIVTVVGSGGIGKTRTSLQVAANLLDGSGDGVWFVELAPLTSGAYIASTIAQIMGIALRAEGDPLTDLVRALENKHALLVFDNCEHVLDAAARAIARILRACPKIAVLASSRQALGIDGEATYRMPSLGVPSEAEALTLRAADATKYAAIALFVDRARSADDRFVLGDDTAPIVADICRRLDGIALAIELAASRAKMLSPRQLRDRLSERFRVLTGGNRDLLPRQQTLRALIDWSYDLLDERERALFRRLAIFVNGFTIEAASAVGAAVVARDAPHLDEFDVFDLLASLVEKSLVLAEPHGDSLRYGLLESTRAYALEKLADAGESERSAAEHLRYFRNRFETLAAEQERSGKYAQKLEVFIREIEDVRAALDDGLARDAIAGAELLAAIERFWEFFGNEREGIARIEAYLAALPEIEALLSAKLSGTLASLFTHCANHTLALASAIASVAYARTAGDAPALAYALMYATWAHMKCGSLDAASAALTEAESFVEPSTRLRSLLLSTRAEFSNVSGDLDAATLAYERLRDDARARGNTRNELLMTMQIGEIAFQRGDAPAAIAVIRTILPALRRGSDLVLLATAYSNLAHFFAAVDDFAASREMAASTIETLASHEPGGFLVTSAIQCIALLEAIGGESARGARLAAYVAAAYERLGTGRGYIERSTYERTIARLASHASAGEATAPRTEDVALTPEDAIALALS